MIFKIAVEKLFPEHTFKIIFKIPFSQVFTTQFFKFMPLDIQIYAILSKGYVARFSEQPYEFGIPVSYRIISGKRNMSNAWVEVFLEITPDSKFIFEYRWWESI